MTVSVDPGPDVPEGPDFTAFGDDIIIWRNDEQVDAVKENVLAPHSVQAFGGPDPEDDEPSVWVLLRIAEGQPQLPLKFNIEGAELVIERLQAAIDQARAENDS